MSIIGGTKPLLGNVPSFSRMASTAIGLSQKLCLLLQNASFLKSHAQLMQAVSCSNVPSVCIATGGVVGSLESQALGSLAMGCR